MPNKRRAGQTFIGTQIDVNLVVQLDRARGRKDRSQFVREAIAEKLKKMGVAVPDNLIYPPQRAQIINFSGTNRGGITQSIAAESPPLYGGKKKGKKRGPP